MSTSSTGRSPHKNAALSITTTFAGVSSSFPILPAHIKMNANGGQLTHIVQNESSRTSSTGGSKATGSDSPPVIPPEHGEGRTLILCFDGTNGQFDGYNSNVVQFVSLLEKDDRKKQLVYYQVRYLCLNCNGLLTDTVSRQAGLGTYTSPKITTPIVSTIAEVFDSVRLVRIEPLSCLLSGFGRSICLEFRRPYTGYYLKIEVF